MPQHESSGDHITTFDLGTMRPSVVQLWEDLAHQRGTADFSVKVDSSVVPTSAGQTLLYTVAVTGYPRDIVDAGSTVEVYRSMINDIANL